MKSKFATFATATSFLVLFNTTSAFAVDAEAVWEGLVAKAKENNVEITWNNIEQPADDAIVVNKIKIQGKDAPLPLLIDRLRAEGVEEADGDLYQIGSLSLEKISANGTNQGGHPMSLGIGSIAAEGVKIAVNKEYSADKFNLEALAMQTASPETGSKIGVSMDGLEATGFYYPAPSNFTAPLYKYENSSYGISNLIIASGGQTVMNLPKMNAQLTCDSSLTKCQGNGEVTDTQITIPEGSVPEKSRANLAAFGLDKGFTFAMKTEYSNDLESGDAAVQQMAMTVKELGSFDISLHFKGITQQFVNDMRKLQWEVGQRQAQAMQSGEPVKPDPADQAAMVNLFSPLQVVDLSLRYNDLSFTNKLLDYQAGKSGTSREELAASMPMLAGIMLAQMNNPEFAKQTSQAIMTYFENPKNLTIAANPDSPVSIGQIMGMAMITPFNLVDLLKVTVTANQ